MQKKHSVEKVVIKADILDGKARRRRLNARRCLSVKAVSYSTLGGVSQSCAEKSHRIE